MVCESCNDLVYHFMNKLRLCNPNCSLDEACIEKIVESIKEAAINAYPSNKKIQCAGSESCNEVYLKVGFTEPEVFCESHGREYVNKAEF